MPARRLLALAILAIAFGCEGHQSPTAPSVVKNVPLDSTAVLSDGAHGGNPDFYFLPPLVPFPHTTKFEIGKFNATLKPFLSVEICQLETEYNLAHVEILPLPTTNCVTGDPLKKFPAASVQLVNLPLRQWGWWTAFNLPPDGFYYVLWDTRPQHGQPALLNNKYYRIKVFVGSTVPMGYADVDPMGNLREWKYSLTGQVIQLVNGWMLPIPFRIQNGALCGGANSCTSETVSNKNPDGSGSTIVKVVGNDGFAIAGAKFPDGWLGPDPTSHVVVTISSVNTGPDKPDGTVGTRCHATLDLQQFRSCFKFTTTPVLPFIGDTDKQFYVPVTVAVCYRLQGSGDPRAKFAEMYASNAPTEAPHALTDASDEGILGVPDRNCGSNRFGLRSSNPLIQLASAGWDKVKGGLGRVFGVKTAYAVDGGLGGFIDAFSFVGPAVTANIERSSRFAWKLGYGESRPSSVRITGTQFHRVIEPPIDGINGMPVTLSVSAGGGSLTDNLGTGTVRTVMTEDVADFFLGNNGAGFARIDWNMPSVPGIYTLTATSPAFGGPITFADTVRGARLMLSMQTGATYQIVVPPPAVSNWASSDPLKVSVSSGGLVTAIVGGENINGGNDVALTSSVSGVEAHSGLVNSFAFDRYPRLTTVVWVSVLNAASYRIERQHAESCSIPTQTCNWVGDNGAGTVTTDVTLTFDFVGAQPGRWRVTPLNSDGVAMSDPSPWVYFGYNI